VLTPAEHEENLPAEHTTWAGRAVPFPYNGSMASVQFGPVTAARVRRWLRDGGFDVVHVHEPATPSVSLLVCIIAKGPIVATFHAATTRSKILAAGGPWMRPWLEKITGRIAVSDFARRVQVEHLGGDAVVIPNGVHVGAFAAGPPLPGYARGGNAPTIGFLGRYDEPRKGLPVLLEAMRTLVRDLPDARLLVAGRGDSEAFRELVGEALAPRVTLLGELTEPEKAAFLRSVDVYCAPNLLGESFGVVLLEAMAAGAPVVASDLDAFARVLADGAGGVLVRRGEAAELAAALSGLLADPVRRAQLAAAGRRVVAEYDWAVVAERILAVYETVAPTGGIGVTAADEDDEALLGRPLPPDGSDGGTSGPFRRWAHR
jgi:phosphatidylinositol alpha-mannosyltransferase